jgi:predicted TIM-barrel fold metal-dependent hydrolase
MELKYGLISCDSHAQERKTAFLDRMSKKKWGSRIPHVAETTDKAAMITPQDKPVERWFIDDKVAEKRGTVNCPTAMGDPLRKTYPQRWDEVPVFVYDPKERIKAQEKDGIDGEVLFPNVTGQSGEHFVNYDADFELALCQAYNDLLTEEWTINDRYVGLAYIPYKKGIDATVKEIRRAVKNGHRGIVMLSEPSQAADGLPHLNDPYWYPVWAACQELDAPVHFHASGGMKKLNMDHWTGYTRNQVQAMGPSASFGLQAQSIPNLLLSGILDKFPNTKFICAETGLGWLNYILEACDHVWEQRHLWTEGLPTRPSDLFKRQVFVDFWYEYAGIEQRHAIGLENIMWESDFPHSTSTWPESWTFIDRTLKGVPDDEKHLLMAGNAIRIYKMDAKPAKSKAKNGAKK